MANISREKVRYRRDFAKAQRYTIHDLRAEIAASHLATAHRIAHTLKSLAALIDEEDLRAISLKVEQSLRKKRIPSEPDMQALEAELDHVLVKIAASGILNDDDLPPASTEQTALFDKLENLLSASDASCIELIAEISKIPETKVLTRQIEIFAFKDALVTLKVLRDLS